MSTWTKAEIRRKIRQVTGRLSQNEISDDDLDDRINKFYQYTFPADVKLERNHTFYEFLTTPYEAIYTAPDLYTNFEPLASINLQEVTWFQDPVLFEMYNGTTIISATPWTGDGVALGFTTNVAALNITPGSLLVTDKSEVFADTNSSWSSTAVSLAGSLGGTGTVNYSTGDITVNFVNPPSNGTIITISYAQFNASQPISVLYYNNKFKFFPAPDTTYRFKIKAYAKLSPLVNASDRPLLDQWGPCIAYGTARELCVDFGEMDSYSDITALYKEQIAYVLNRTTQDLLNTRALPYF